METTPRRLRSLVFWASVALAAVGLVLRVAAGLVAAGRGVRATFALAGRGALATVRVGTALPRTLVAAHPALSVAAAGATVLTALAAKYGPLA